MTHGSFEYLGPYLVERLIGRGGMGSVYKAVHSKSGEPVAIKVIASAIANQPRFRRRFAAEIEALKRLQHPNIVSLIGYGEEQGLLFYVMEYVAGQSLYELMRTRGKLDWQDAIHVGIETSAALKHAHNIGIIHRDLKPANLMLDTKGTIKLTDFGIAKLFGSTDETAAGSVVGTADYMPPEQAEGKMVTARSDLYSLGCVLFALLAGRPPFNGKSLPEVLYAVRYSSTPDLSAFADKAPVELIELVHQLLSKDPQKRPPTALVVNNRLKSVQQALKSKSSLTGEQSVSSSPPPTKQLTIGNKLTSIDMQDDDDLPPGNAKIPPSVEGAETGFLPGTHEQQTLAASSSVIDDRAQRNKPFASKTDSHSADLARKFPVNSSETSLHSSAATGASQVMDGGVNHYTPITDEDKTSFTIASARSSTQDGWDWVQTISVAAMVLALVCSFAFAAWMLKPPSADQLYRTILLAAESGDDSQLLACEVQLSEFLDRFPEDDRAGEIQALNDEVDLLRQIRILQRKASRSETNHGLSAVELGFLECMLARSRDPQLGREKLAAFIGIFDNDLLSAGDRRFVELAIFAQNAQATVLLEKEPLAKTQLDSIIQSAEKSMSADQLEQFYRNLLRLYDDKPWAQEQVARIKQRQPLE